MNIDIDALPSVSFGDLRQLPDVSAVYFVMDGDSTILYIGRAVNLNSRFRSHEYRKDFIEWGCVQVRWHEVGGPELNRVERDLIDEIGPPLNGRTAKIKLPYNIATALGAYASAHGITRPKAIEQAILHLLESAPSSIEERVAALEADMAALKKLADRVDKLPLEAATDRCPTERASLPKPYTMFTL